MAIKGRKPKPGKRTKSGRLSRAGISVRDKGTQAMQDKQSIYGTDGSDAIGRAYRSGLLGDDADALLHGARSIASAYWPMLGHGVEKCALGDRTGGFAEALDRDAMDRAIERERRLKENLERVDQMGRNVRRAFDGLVIDINPDCGPAWLDRMIDGNGTVADRTSLRLALSALRELVGVDGKRKAA